jgi:hypothetical protein
MLRSAGEVMRRTTVTTAKTVVTVVRGTTSPVLRSMPGLFDPV